MSWRVGESRGGQQGVEVPGGVARLLKMVHQLTHQASDVHREKEMGEGERRRRGRRREGLRKRGQMEEKRCLLMVSHVMCDGALSYTLHTHAVSQVASHHATQHCITQYRQDK